MQITTSFRNMQPSNSLTLYIEKKMSQLSARHGGPIASLKFVIDIDKQAQILNCHVSLSNGDSQHFHYSGSYLYDMVDNFAHELKRFLDERRDIGKTRRLNRKTSIKAINLTQNEEEEVDAYGDFD